MMMNDDPHQIREGDKSIFQVLDWYNDINNFFIDYISQSIHDSENSEVYRFIIGFKNLLRYIVAETVLSQS